MALRVDYSSAQSKLRSIRRTPIIVRLPFRKRFREANSDTDYLPKFARLAGILQGRKTSSKAGLRISGWSDAVE